MLSKVCSQCSIIVGEQFVAAALSSHLTKFIYSLRVRQNCQIFKIAQL